MKDKKQNQEKLPNIYSSTNSNNNSKTNQSILRRNEIIDEYIKSINEYNQLKNEYNGAEQDYQRTLRDLRELENVGIKLESDLNKINQGLKEINEAIKGQKDFHNKSNTDMQQINRIKIENEKLTKENIHTYYFFGK